MNIIYKDNNVDVDLEINDNVTIIAGDSGTGKTYLFNRLKSIFKIYANNKFKPDFIYCNRQMNEFIFINNDNVNDLLLYLNNSNKHFIYIIDRAEIFFTEEIINLINNSSSTFIIFARNIPGLKCRLSSYCYLKSWEEDGKYYFKNISRFR